MIRIGRLDHVSIIVADLDASYHFYVDVLGMEEVARPTTFNFAGQWFRKNGAEVHTLHVDGVGQAPGDGENIVREGRGVAAARHFCFTIDDVDETVKWLEQQGVPVVQPPRPRGDGVIQLYIYDPDGHLVELAYDPRA